jgi:hypothetical protein
MEPSQRRTSAGGENFGARACGDDLGADAAEKRKDNAEAQRAQSRAESIGANSNWHLDILKKLGSGSVSGRPQSEKSKSI